MYYRTIVADPPWQFRNNLDMNDGVVRAAHHHYSCMDVEGIRWFLRGSPASVIHDLSPEPEILFGETLVPRNTMLEDLIAEDAILWLWAPSAFIVDGTATLVARSWGFEPKQIVTWVKGRLDLQVALPKLHAIEPESDRWKPSVFRYLRRMIDLYVKPRLVLNVGMGRFTRNCTEHMLLCTRGKAASMVLNKGVPNVFVAPRGAHSAKPDAAFDLIRRVSPGPYLSIFERKSRAGFDVIGDELTSLDEAAA